MGPKIYRSKGNACTLLETLIFIHYLEIRSKCGHCVLAYTFNIANFAADAFTI